MTNQRKIFGAVLTLAVSAFGVDHWFMGPAESGGSPPPQTPAPAGKGSRGGSPESANATHAPAPAARPLAARLLEAARAERIAPDAADGTAFVPDAFKPSSLWYPAPAAAPAAAQARPAVPPERLEEFRARHRLTAVMRAAGRQSRGGLAIIGGKVYTPGQNVDGFTLRSIGERSAVLTLGEASVELKIDPPGALTSLSADQ